MAPRYASVDDYISTFPADVRLILEEVRRAILSAAPDAGQKIAYQMPTMTLDDTSLVHFAGWKHHIALYPAPAPDDAFDPEIAPYKASDGTVKFPLKEPIPYDLIERLAALLVRQRGERGA